LVRWTQVEAPGQSGPVHAQAAIREVRRADAEKAIVDDHQLGMEVDRLSLASVCQRTIDTPGTVGIFAETASTDSAAGTSAK
jgi:hypothetical protein